MKSLEFDQKRLRCRFNKGFLFYAELNIRLFFHLLFRQDYDAVCSIDLDTLPAGFAASVLRRKKRVFDAHEYFSEVPEVVDRPLVKWFWKGVARLILPFYRYAYTVSSGLAGIFRKKYRIDFELIRNMPYRDETPVAPSRSEGLKVVMYQGALNEGRGIEALVQAMTQLSGVRLVLAGEGDLSDKLRQMAKDLGLEQKVHFYGYVEPARLRALTREAWLGFNLLENRGLSYYYSLANKFFDYVQAGKPALNMNFPEYEALNAEFQVAVLLDELSPDSIAAAIQNLLNDKNLYKNLQENCLRARAIWTWENEEKTLLKFWDKV